MIWAYFWIIWLMYTCQQKLNPYTQPIYSIYILDLYTRSIYLIYILDLYTRSIYPIYILDLYTCLPLSSRSSKYAVQVDPLKLTARSWPGEVWQTWKLNKNLLDIQKCIQNCSSTLRGWEKWLFVFWPFLVWFRLNLGLNNLKFVHKSISAVHSIDSMQFESSRLLQLSQSSWIWTSGCPRT